MKVSVVIPVRDDRRVVEAVASVVAAAGRVEGAAVEILVVDNASAKGFAEVLRDLPEGVTVLREDTPGPSAARNTGVAASVGDVIFLVDADCAVEPGWIVEGLRGLESTGADMVVGRRAPRGTGRETVGQALVRESTVRGSRPENVHFMSGNAAVRRAVFEGLRFDERLLRAEDWAFSLEARARGFTCSRWEEMRIREGEDERFAARVGKEVATGWAIAEIRLRASGTETGGRRVVRVSAGRWRRMPGHRFLFRAWLLWLIGAGWALEGVASVAGAQRVQGPAVRLRRAAQQSGQVMRRLGMPQPSPAALARGRVW
jgi:glycosyltransferase involved in cell wall biosynthesis